MRKKFLSALSGMSIGLVASLIIGTVFTKLYDYTQIELFSYISSSMYTVTGAAIGAGMGIILKSKGILLLSYLISGQIAGSFVLKNISGSFHIVPSSGTEPLVIFLVVFIVYILSELVFKKGSSFDILIIPFFTALTAGLLTLTLSLPINYLLEAISTLIYNSMELQPILMSILIAVIFAIIITSPVSSVAISISLGLTSYVAGAAVVGTSIQMVGLAVQSIKSNKIGTIIAIFFGTPMLQFKNICRRPTIWLPTLITTTILAPIAFFLGFETTAIGAGMGLSALIGPLETMQIMGYGTNILYIISLLIIIPGILVFLIHLLFLKLRLYQTNDFAIDLNF